MFGRFDWLVGWFGLAGCLGGLTGWLVGWFGLAGCLDGLTGWLVGLVWPGVWAV